MAASPIPGFKVLLMGDGGSGKTTVIKTLVAAGLTPLCIFTENSYDVLGDTPPDKLHWRYVSPTKESLDDLRKQTKQVGTMAWEGLTKAVDATRYSAGSPFDEILEGLFNYKCARTGQEFGNIASWGTDKVFVLDSASGLTLASWQNVAGTRMALSPPDYQLAQKQVANLIHQICMSYGCHFVMTAHPARETDPVNGGTRIYPDLPGKALGPNIGRYFTDVIFTDHNGPVFTWSTVSSQAALKTRNLGYKADLPPSFVPLVEAWKKRGGIISPEPVQM